MDGNSKQIFKRQINKNASMMLFYQLVFYIAIITYTAIKTIRLGIKSGFTGDDLSEQVFNHLMESGWASIVAILLGMLMILIYRKKELFSYDLVSKNKDMNINIFFKMILCLMLCQVIFFIISTGAEALLNSFGYTIMSEVEIASSTSTTFSMFLYASVLGPISEEIVFRGALLRGLEKHGKVFAIVMSSILFGVFHANLVQGIFAAALGLVLGYVTIEYSIKWAIALHIINNLIFVDLLGFIMNNLSLVAQDILDLILLAISLIGGLLVLFKNKNYIKNYITTNKSKEKSYLYTFSSLGIIIFIIINLIIAIGGIERLV